ncbi:MAG: bifunctional chorismate mutase/prephenate dehydratase [Vicinamibacterales bacterium]
MDTEGLAGLRRHLDEIDAVVVAALGERARLSREIAEAKRDAGTAVRDPGREAALLEHRSRLAERAGLDPAFVRRLYREILDDSVRWQAARLRAPAALRVGYQGVEGAYGHQAAWRHFAQEAGEITLRPYRTFRRLAEAVLDGEVERGVLPLENTTAGSVHEVYDLLQRFSLALVGEEVVAVEHCLMGVPGATVAGLRRVHSHPQALAQCSEFLAGLPACEGVTASNTAVAAKTVSERREQAEGAIASPEAAVWYGLDVLARDITNEGANYTRFVVVAPVAVPCDPRLAARVSLVMATPHAHGALAACLEVVAAAGLNLTKLESRPRPGAPWEYLFYLDLEGHTADPRMQAALAALEARTLFTRVLGCYPARDLPRPRDIEAPAAPAS